MVCRERKICSIISEIWKVLFYLFVLFILYVLLSIINFFILNLYNSMEILCISYSRHWKTAAAASAATASRATILEYISLCVPQSLTGSLRVNSEQ